jgi:hypothetical protein
MQEQGLIGRLVGAMIRRSVRQRFHSVYLSKPDVLPKAPAILYANHHGWMDGYLMFHLASELGIDCLDWIEEFDAFPLFASVGGIKFPKDDPSGRASAIRRTIRLMRNEGKSLVIFPEGVLHRPPELLPFGRALEVVAKSVPNVTLHPVSLRYELSMHERPEAWISIGEGHPYSSLGDCQLRLAEEMDHKSANHQYSLMFCGRLDVNERMSMKRFSRDSGSIRRRP